INALLASKVRRIGSLLSSVLVALLNRPGPENAGRPFASPLGPYQPARPLMAKYCISGGRKPRSMYQIVSTAQVVLKSVLPSPEQLNPGTAPNANMVPH